MLLRVHGGRAVSHTLRHTGGHRYNQSVGPYRPAKAWEPYSHGLATHCSLKPDGHTTTQAERNKPLVVLVGWLGARKKHVEKYAAMWQEAGHSTLHVQPRISSIMIPVLADQQSHSFWKDLTAQTLQPRQVVFHVFRLMQLAASNAGFIFLGTCYRALAQAQHIRLPEDAAPGAAGLEKTAVRLTSDSRRLGGVSSSGKTPESSADGPGSSLEQPLGIIFDSSPALLTPSMAARGLISATLAEPAAGIENRHPRLVVAMQAVFHAVLRLPYVRNRLEEIWGAWAVSPLCPQLYLYSSDDTLMPVADIKAFMQQQAARGVEVSSRVWQDAPHCEILRLHKQEYEETARAFVASLLKNG